MNKNLFKRFLSVILIVALVLSSASLSWATEAGQTVSITDGQIVAANYKDSLGLSNEEIAILESTSIRGEVHTLTAPDAEEELITVDSEARSIVAREYKDAQGNVWIPESADVVYAEGSESIELKDGKGKFTYTGKNYSVEVTYNAYVEVRNQETLINTPYYLAKGVENLDILADDCSTYLMLMETIIPQMMQLVDGSLMVKLQEGSEASNAIIEFNRQIEESGTLDLLKYLEAKDGYLEAESKVKYLLDSGATIKTCTIESYENAKAIVESEGINTILTFASAMPSYANAAKQLKRAIDQIALLVEHMTPVYEDSWSALDGPLLRTDAEYKFLLDAMMPIGAVTDVVSADSAIDYVALDKLVEAAIGKSSEHTFLARNPLLAASTKVACNINRNDVTVKINANVIPKNQADSATLGSLEEVSEVVTLPGGATEAEILEAIAESGIEEKALQIWNYGIGTENYNRTVTELPDSLTENISYTITYSPKTYKLQFAYDSSLNMEVPYGYNHTLQVSPDAERAYDYTIAGELYMQGEIYSVTGDTEISRTEGKAREGYRLAELVAEDYADTLTDKEEAILYSLAIKSDSLSIRIADNEDEKQIVIDGQTLAAEDYDAGADGLIWKPVTANVIRGEEVIESLDFNGNSVDFESTDYEYIDVEYRLTIRTGDDAEIRELLNLPYKLVEEAETQKADMDQLLAPAVYNNLGSINKTMLNAMSGNLGDESKEAIEFIKDKAFDEESGKFYLYEYLTNYKKDGLTYYYQNGNHARIREQVIILADQLSVIANDELLPPLLDDLGYSSYKDKIDEAVAKLEEMRNGFAVPNEAIDTESDELAALVAAINQQGNVNSYKKADGLKKGVVLKEAASNVTFVTIEVNVLKGNGQLAGKEKASISFVKGSIIEDTSLLTSTLATMEESLGIDKDNYTCQVVGSMPESGHVMQRSVTVRYTWSPNEYSVSIDGTDVVIPFTYDDTRITLPLCEEPNRAYVYTIAGKEFEATVNDNVFEFTKEFSKEEFNDIFAENSNLVITRIVEDVNRRDILDLVDELNKALAEDGAIDGNGNLNMAFIPLERNGELEVVLRLTVAGASENLMNALPSIVEVLITSKYGYVALNDSPFINEGTVSLQTLINTMLSNEGFGTGTVLNAIDVNGDINELQLDNAVVLGAKDNTIPVSKSQINQTDLLGGRLIQATIQFGKNIDSADYKVPFYITIEDFDQHTDELKNSRSNIEKMAEQLSVESHSNVLNINRTLDDKEYAKVLAKLVLENRADLNNISEISLKEMFDNEREAIGQLLNNSKVDATTIKNTWDKNGSSLLIDTDESTIEKLLDVARDFNENLRIESVSSENGSYTFNANYSVEALFAEYNMPAAIKNMIAEKDSGLVLPAKLTLSNIGKEYEAFILDASKADSEKLTLTTDLAEAIANADSGVVVTILNDVDGNIHFNNSAVLNLNGKTINGNLSGDEAVMVIDNSGADTAKVTGSVSGALRISAGSYNADVTSMIPTGYEQVNGAVRNSYYKITKDVKGNYNILLDAGYLISGQPVQHEYLAVEMATDFVLSTYSSAALSVGGVKMYEAQIDAETDSMDSLINQAIEGINCEGIEHLSNKFLAALTDFAGIASSISNNNELAAYEVTTTPWDFGLNVEGEEAESYISSVITSGADIVTSSLSIRIDGTEASKAELKSMSTELANIVTVNKFNVDVSDMAYAGGKLNVTTFAQADLAVDFTHDANYAIALGIITANSISNRAAMVAAVNEALSQAQNRDALVKELEKLSPVEIVSALEAARGLSISAMAQQMGISANKLSGKEVLYHNILAAAYGFVNRNEIEVSDSAISQYKKADTYAAYKVVKENWNGMDFSLEINLCEEGPKATPTPTPTPTPLPTATDIVTPTPTVGVTSTPVPTATDVVTPTPTATTTATPVPVATATPIPTGSGKITPVINLVENRDLFYGGEIQGMVIFIDTRSQGVSEEQFIQNMVMFNVTDGQLDRERTKFVEGVKGGLITNGSVIEVVAVMNDGSDIAEYYKVILKGDVNCDGKSNSTDAVLLSDYWLEYNNTTLTEDQLLAADMDCEDTWNNTDAVLMGDKFFGYEYVSALAYH